MAGLKKELRDLQDKLAATYRAQIRAYAILKSNPESAAARLNVSSLEKRESTLTVAIRAIAKRVRRDG